MQHATGEQFCGLLLGDIGKHPFLSLPGNHVHIPQRTAHHEQPSDDVAEQRQQSARHVEMHRPRRKGLRRNDGANCTQQRGQQGQHRHAVAVRMKAEQIPQPVFHRGEHHAQPQQSQRQLNDAVASGGDRL